ncbi:DUF5683 domain-containing protein [Reichenbachiella versicolor]|uniref:DUF5683 domain-containing protein n=1 Tax=Reichenbachiella versicolor TaxID=1821036 RepID=UPI000D6E43B1|nr:DUF5683 domain-containing protein [Reichenbachiella versicolor]
MRNNLVNSSIVFLLLSIGHFSWGQEKSFVQLDSALNSFPQIETFQSKSKLDPNRAALYSAVIPGLGQIYNKQYWKLPILYGGAILIGHYIKYNHDFYNGFRNAYIARRDGGDVPENYARFDIDRLQYNAEKFKRDRDFLIIIGCVYYVLNIVDAHVAAHLSEFEINDDLSLSPAYEDNSQFARRNLGLSLTLNLNK